METKKLKVVVNYTEVQYFEKEYILEMTPAEYKKFNDMSTKEQENAYDLCSRCGDEAHQSTEVLGIYPANKTEIDSILGLQRILEDINDPKKSRVYFKYLGQYLSKNILNIEDIKMDAQIKLAALLSNNKKL